MRASIPEESKDFSITGESVWTERETVLKNKSVLVFANNRIMAGLRTFQRKVCSINKGCHTSMI